MSVTMKRYIFTVTATLLCCIGILCTACCAVEVAAKVGAKAPDFSLPTIDSDTLTLNELRGVPVVLTFWNTQCGWCLYQMPFFQDAHEEIGQDVRIVAIDIGESAGLIREFADYFGFTFTFALDYYGSVSNAYNLMGTPTTVLIDSDGIIQVIKVGAYLNTSALLNDLNDLK